MNAYGQYLGPIVGFCLFGLALIVLALRWPRITRFVVGVGFVAAAGVNTVIGITSPQSYVEYAKHAWWFYPDFITGPFADYTRVFVLFIAAGQLSAGLLALVGGRFRRLGLVGMVVFLLAITPLGVGAAFPSTLVMAAGLVVLYRRTQGLSLSEMAAATRPRQRDALQGRSSRAAGRPPKAV